MPYEKGIYINGSIGGNLFNGDYFLGIIGAYRLGMKVVQISKARITALSLTNQQMEKVRNYSYAEVGTVNGYPEGRIPKSYSTTSNKIEYTIKTRIDYIDDSFDGLFPNDCCPEGCDATATPECPTGACPHDYKFVEVKTSWGGLFGGKVEHHTQISPFDELAECKEEGGVLKVSVQGQGGGTTTSPTIEVEKLSTDLSKTAFPEDGIYNFLLPQGIDDYKVTVSKEGYSTSTTYGSGDVYQGRIISDPGDPDYECGAQSHRTVINEQQREAIFCIDELSIFSVRVLEAEAETIYYVRESGDDDNSGLSPNTAFGSLSKAATVAEAGDMVLVGAGDYRGDIEIANSGVVGNPISFVADTKGSYTNDSGPVVISGGEDNFRLNNKSYVEIYGFTIENASSSGIKIQGNSDHVEIINNTVSDNRNFGIKVKESSAVDLIANDIFSNGTTATASAGISFNETTDSEVGQNHIYINGGEGVSVSDCSSINFKNNKIYSNQGTGIYLSGHMSEGSLRSNLVYDNSESGIGLAGSDVGSVLNNTCFKNQEGGISLTDSNAGQIENNIVVGNSVGIEMINSSSTVVDFNDVWQNDSDYEGASAGSSGISADPLLVDPNGVDNDLGGRNGGDDKFYLSQMDSGQSQDSPCVDAGGDSGSDLDVADQTTRTDEKFDSGVVDLGFHYSLEPSPVIDPFGEEIADVSFNMRGDRTVGRDASNTPIYKYSENITTDGSGHKEITKLEYDDYTFSDFEAAGQNLELMTSWPSSVPIHLPPGVDKELKLGIKAENKLTVTVVDASTTAAIDNERVVSVRVYNESYDQTQTTDEYGETHFIPLAEGNYNIQVSAKDYQTATSTVWVSGSERKAFELKRVE